MPPRTLLNLGLGSSLAPPWHFFGTSFGSSLAPKQRPALVEALRAAPSVAALREAHGAYIHGILETCMLLPRAAKVT